MSEGFENLSWDDVRRMVNQLAMQRGEWAGYPLPIEDLRLIMEPRYPLPSMDGASLGSENMDVDDQEISSIIRNAFGECETIFPINEWYHGNKWIWVYHNGDGRSKVAKMKLGRDPRRRCAFLLNTLLASRAWSVDGELKAQRMLLKELSEVQQTDYILTGTFVETSPRSKVSYIFRRGRSTLAIKMEPGAEPRVLCALCLHPSGYYEFSFAGCMTPSDEVYCHLSLMRYDEHTFWKKANQHDPEIAEAGL